VPFSKLGLSPKVVDGVRAAGYAEPTAIQLRAIPLILEGRDVIGSAQTGTGKTAAFALPMISRLGQRGGLRALVLEPTRELAAQVETAIRDYARFTNLRTVVLYGGTGYGRQDQALRQGADIVVATPGRLLDQLQRRMLRLDRIQLLVLDEADRMLDMGFMPDVERIVNLVSKRRQTLMFSATMPGEIRRLAGAFLTHPQEVQATPPATMAERIVDHFAVVPPRQKFKALRRLIDSHDVANALIFCNRKREVASLRRQMERAGLSVRDIHGDLDQAQRTAALEAFKRGEIAYLVATDVAARGLDIAMLPCVINYDVPTHADDYVHRIGRTGRAGQEGRAFTLVLPEERRYVDAIARLTGKAIPRLEISGMQPEVLEEDESRARPRRGRAATRPAVEAALPEEVAVEETAGEAPPAQPPAPTEREAAAEEAAPTARRRSGRRGRGRSEAKPEPTSAARPAAPGPERPRGRGRPERPDQPVVGMGDHVPLFMRRPVPQIETLPDPIED